jgi:RNA polymerase sigma-70 factor (ECF subfamily)
MSEKDSFADFLSRIRAGDEDAAAELVRRYGALIRREVRMRLGDPRLFRVVGSDDVCQSVFRSFFVRAAAGQYDLEQPGQLLALLVRMAHNKVGQEVRRQRAGRRDARRTAGTPVDEVDVAGGEPSPSRIVAARELLHEVRQRLTEEERRLADLRAQGRTWSEIAAEVGGTDDARRMQLARALDRVMRELGLDEEGEE